MKRTTAYLVEAEKIEFVDEEIRALADDEMLIRNIAVGMCHTDLPPYLGETEIARDVYPFATMRRGVKYPAILGHEPIAVVEEVGSRVTKFKPGDIITGLITSAYTTHIICKVDGLVKIPKMEKRLEYCLGEPLSCIVNIVRAAAPEYGDCVAVVGCGMMGLMIMSGLRSAGLKCMIGIDLRDDRLEDAKKYGATHVVNPKKEDVQQRCYDITEGNGCDVVVEITGGLKGLNTACSIVRIAERYTYKGRGKILIPSMYGREEMWDPNIGYNLMLRGPILHSTHPMYGMDIEDNVRKGVAGYINGTLPMDEMITHEYPFEKLNEAMDLMKSGDPSYKKGVILF